MESTEKIPHEHVSLLCAFWRSFHHHKARPTKHGLRLFLSNIEMAQAIIHHAQEDLKKLHAEASALLREVEREDTAVAEYTAGLAR